MNRALLLLSLLVAAPAYAAEKAPSETDARFQAAIQELVMQRDLAQARSANLAGDAAAANLKVRELEEQIRKRDAAETPRK